MSQQSEKSNLQTELDLFEAQLVEKYPDLMASFQGAINDLAKTGLATRSVREGEQAPDFTLPDALGNQIALVDLLKQGPVVVTFYRGQWCPFCNLQLRAYQQILPQINALGATLVAISPQTPDQSLSTVEKAELAFTVLSDAGNKVARLYRLIFTIPKAMRSHYLNSGADLPAFNGDDSWEIPIPGTFLLDQTGRVRFAFADADYTRRLEPVTLLKHLHVLGEKGKAETDALNW